jgi:transposase
MAARSVLAGVVQDSPKSGVDKVEMIRMLKTTKDSAIKARTRAINQMQALIVTAPDELRTELRLLTTAQLLIRCAGWRHNHLGTPTEGTKYAL